MSDFTLTTVCPMTFEATTQIVRTALADAGFGVLTEIDLQATLAEKLGVEVMPEVILGACNPRFAYAAIQAEPSIAALLPCNVVVRSLNEDSTLVEVFDPLAMARLVDTDSHELAAVVEDVRGLLRGMLNQVAELSRVLEED